MHSCYICSDKFDNRTDLSIHMSKRHIEPFSSLKYIPEKSIMELYGVKKSKADYSPTQPQKMNDTPNRLELIQSICQYSLILNQCFSILYIYINVFVILDGMMWLK